MSYVKSKACSIVEGDECLRKVKQGKKTVLQGLERIAILNRMSQVRLLYFFTGVKAIGSEGGWKTLLISP